MTSLRRLADVVGGYVISAVVVIVVAACAFLTVSFIVMLVKVCCAMTSTIFGLRAGLASLRTESPLQERFVRSILINLETV